MLTQKTTIVKTAGSRGYVQEKRARHAAPIRVTSGNRTRDPQDHNLVLYLLSYNHHSHHSVEHFRISRNIMVVNTLGIVRSRQPAPTHTPGFADSPQTTPADKNPAPEPTPQYPPTPDATCPFPAGDNTPAVSICAPTPSPSTRQSSGNATPHLTWAYTPE